MQPWSTILHIVSGGDLDISGGFQFHGLVMTKCEACQHRREGGQHKGRILQLFEEEILHSHPTNELQGKQQKHYTAKPPPARPAGATKYNQIRETESTNR